MNLFGSIATKYALKYLGQYFDGEAIICDITVKKSALDNLGLFFKAKSGHLDKLYLKIPWKALGSESTIIRIEGFNLVFESRPRSPETAAEIDEILHKKKLDKLKIAKLLNNDRVDSDKRDSQVEGSSKPHRRMSFYKSIQKKLINNIQIYIDRVHIRYEDDTHGDDDFRKFFVDLTFENFFVQSTDSQWNPAVTSSKDQVLWKLIELTNFSVYMSRFSRAEPHLPPFNENKKKTQKSNYILDPFSFQIRLCFNQSIYRKSIATNFNAELTIKSARIKFKKSQYDSLMNLMQRFILYKNNIRYMRFLPNLRETKNKPLAYWKYVIDCVTFDIRRNSCNINSVRTYQRNFHKYIDIWKNEGKKKILPQEIEVLDKLEREFSYEDILFFRDVAKKLTMKKKTKKESQENTSKSSKKSSVHQSKKVKSSDSLHLDDDYNSTALINPFKLEKLEPAVIEGLYESLEYKDHPGDVDTKRTSVSYRIDYIFNIKIGLLSFGLYNRVNGKDVKIARLYLKDNSIGTFLGANGSFKFFGSIRRIQIIEYRTFNGSKLYIFRAGLDPKNDVENNFNWLFEKNFCEESTNAKEVYFFGATIQNFYLTINRLFFVYLTEFFHTGGDKWVKKEVADRATSKMKRIGKKRLDRVFNERKVELDLTFKSIFVIVPQSFKYDKEMLAISFGQVDIDSIHDLSSVQKLFHLDGTDLADEERFYENCVLSVLGFKIGMLKSQVELGMLLFAVNESQFSSMSNADIFLPQAPIDIVKEMEMKIYVRFCKSLHDYSELPRIKVIVSIGELRLDISSDRIFMLRNLVEIFTGELVSKKGDDCRRIEGGLDEEDFFGFMNHSKFLAVKSTKNGGIANRTIWNLDVDMNFAMDLAIIDIYHRIKSNTVKLLEIKLEDIATTLRYLDYGIGINSKILGIYIKEESFSDIGVQKPGKEHCNHYLINTLSNSSQSPSLELVYNIQLLDMGREGSNLPNTAANDINASIGTLEIFSSGIEVNFRGVTTILLLDFLHTILRNSNGSGTNSVPPSALVIKESVFSVNSTKHFKSVILKRGEQNVAVFDRSESSDSTLSISRSGIDPSLQSAVVKQNVISSKVNTPVSIQNIGGPDSNPLEYQGGIQKSNSRRSKPKKIVQKKGVDKSKIFRIQLNMRVLVVKMSYCESISLIGRGDGLNLSFDLFGDECSSTIVSLNSLGIEHGAGKSWRCILSNNADFNAQLKFNVYRRDVTEYPGFKYHLDLRISSARLVFLMQVARGLKDYFSNFIRMKNFFLKWKNDGRIFKRTAKSWNLRICIRLTSIDLVIPKSHYEGSEYFQLGLEKALATNQLLISPKKKTKTNRIKVDFSTVEIYSFIFQNSQFDPKLVLSVRGASIEVLRLVDAKHSFWVPAQAVELKIPHLDVQVSQTQLKLIFEVFYCNLCQFQAKSNEDYKQFLHYLKNENSLTSDYIDDSKVCTEIFAKLRIVVNPLDLTLNLIRDLEFNNERKVILELKFNGFRMCISLFNNRSMDMRLHVSSFYVKDFLHSKYDKIFFSNVQFKHDVSHKKGNALDTKSHFFLIDLLDSYLKSANPPTIETEFHDHSKVEKTRIFNFVDDSVEFDEFDSFCVFQKEKAIGDSRRRPWTFSNLENDSVLTLSVEKYPKEQRKLHLSFRLVGLGIVATHSAFLAIWIFFDPIFGSIKNSIITFEKYKYKKNFIYEGNDYWREGNDARKKGEMGCFNGGYYSEEWGYELEVVRAMNGLMARWFVVDGGDDCDAKGLPMELVMDIDFAEVEVYIPEDEYYGFQALVLGVEALFVGVNLIGRNVSSSVRFSKMHLGRVFLEGDMDFVKGPITTLVGQFDGDMKMSKVVEKERRLDNIELQFDCICISFSYRDIQLLTTIIKYFSGIIGIFIAKKGFGHSKVKERAKGHLAHVYPEFLKVQKIVTVMNKEIHLKLYNDNNIYLVVPLVRVLVGDVELFVSLVEHEIFVSLYVERLEPFSYNNDLMAYEPVIEHFQFEFLFKRERDIEDCITFKCDSDLTINVSRSLLEVLCDIYGSISALKPKKVMYLDFILRRFELSPGCEFGGYSPIRSKIFRRKSKSHLDFRKSLDLGRRKGLKGKFYPFMIYNATDRVIRFWLSGEGEEMATTLNSKEKRALKFDGGKGILTRKDDFSSMEVDLMVCLDDVDLVISRVVLEKISDPRVYTFYDEREVCIVTENFRKGDIKILKISTNRLIENNMENPVRVKIIKSNRDGDGSTISDCFVIEGGKSRYMPIGFMNCDSIYFGLDCFEWHEWHGMATGSSSIIMCPNLTDNWIFWAFIVYYEILEVDGSQLEYIRLYPALQFENLLASMLLLKLIMPNESLEDSPQTYGIESGKICAIDTFRKSGTNFNKNSIAHQKGLDALLCDQSFVFCVGGYYWSEINHLDHLLNSSKPFERQFFLNDLNMNSRAFIVEVQDTAFGGLKLVFYVNYWILNRTGIKLNFRQNSNASTLYDDQFDGFVLTKDPRTWYLRQKMGQVKWRIKFPTKFYYDGDELQIQVAGYSSLSKTKSSERSDFESEWSNSFMLKDGRGAKKSVEEIYLDVLDVKNHRKYMFLCSIIPASKKFWRTHEILITPAYMLVNYTKSLLLYSEYGSTIESAFKLDIDEQIPFHWLNTRYESKKMVVTQIEDKPRFWSSPFPIEIVNNWITKLRSKQDFSQFHPINTRIVELKGIKYIIFSSDHCNFRQFIKIKNFTEHSFLLEQKSRNSGKSGKSGPIITDSSGILRLSNSDDTVSYTSFPYLEMIPPHSKYIYNWDDPHEENKVLIIHLLPGPMKPLDRDYELAINYLDNELGDKSIFKVHNWITGPKSQFKIQVKINGFDRGIAILPESDLIGKKDVRFPTTNVTQIGDYDISNSEKSRKKFLKMNISFEGIGVSVFDSSPQEMVFVHLKGVSLNYYHQKDHKVNLVVKRCQIDNQLYSASNPVILCGLPGDTASFLDVNFSIDKTEKSIYKASFYMSIQKLILNIEQDIVIVLSGFISEAIEVVRNKLMNQKKSECKSAVPLIESPHKAMSCYYYFQEFDLEPIEFVLSLKGATRNNAAIFNPNQKWMQILMNFLRIGSINDQKLVLSKIQFFKKFCTITELNRTILNCYRRMIMNNISHLIFNYFTGMVRTMIGDKVQRPFIVHHLPRYFPPEGCLLPYDQEKSYGQCLLRSVCNSQFHNQHYLSHYFVSNDLLILISYSHLIVLDLLPVSYRIVWTEKIKNIISFVSLKEELCIKIYSQCEDHHDLRTNEIHFKTEEQIDAVIPTIDHAVSKNRFEYPMSLRKKIVKK